LKLPDEKRVDILMAQLSERYGALHKMRDRSMNFTLWILGLGLALAWLLISEVTLNGWQACAVALFLFAIGFCSIVFIRAIHRGFNNNRDIVIRIERLLKLYEEDFYGPVGSVLPKEFSSRKCHWTGHFETLYFLIAVVFVWLVVLTFINPCKRMHASSPGPESGPEVKQFQKE